LPDHPQGFVAAGQSEDHYGQRPSDCRHEFHLAKRVSDGASPEDLNRR